MTDKQMYRKTILENGIRVVTEEMDSVRSVSMGVIIDAGPRDESPDMGGLAHLTEHLMFQGTSSRNAMQIARLTDESGGHTGAFTTRDYTCYSATVLDDYRTYILDLLGDILLNSIFPEEHVVREKRAVLREIDASRDIPGERVNDLLKSFIWADHPLGRPVAGQTDSVSRLTREDIIYFVHENYLPTRIIIAAAGNMRHDDFVAQVRDAFWRMIGEGQAPESRLPNQCSGAVIEQTAVSQAYFSIGIRACPYSHPNRYGMHVLNNVLGQGISSRLFRRMREELGLVYSIGSEYHAYRDDGLLVIEGSTSPEYFLQVLSMTLAELRKLISGEEPADEEELWKAKMQLRGQYLIASENTDTRMSRLATQELYFGRHISADEILKQIESANVGMFQRLSCEGLSDSLRHAALAVVGPESPAYDLRSVEEILEDG